MLAELGLLALIFAFVMSVMQAVLPLLQRWLRLDVVKPLVFQLALLQAVFVVLSFLSLIGVLLSDDFSVAYVAMHSNSLLPSVYKVAAAWGAHEGSLLLWMLILSVWHLLLQSKHQILPDKLVLWMATTFGALSSGFLSFTLWTSNPFLRILPLPPLDGNDLNPILQDPGLIIHPPILYAGYVGFALTFAFAMGALISGELEARWIRWLRPWTLLAWMFLTLGITLGSWWAYYELGWGGWWFWDPVENASLMPWFAGTALVHSLIITEKTGQCKRWTMLLSIVAFSLSLLGTFLVRSGVLTSVHAFAADPKRGLYILIYLGLSVGIALSVFAFKAPSLVESQQVGRWSRPSLLLINNVLLTVMCATVLLGTVYPLILDGLHLGKISVGPPYFNTVIVPIGMLLLVFMGFAPQSRWTTHDVDFRKVYWPRVRMPFVLSILFGLLLTLRLDHVFNQPFSLWTLFGFILGIWLLWTLTQMPRSGQWGMKIAHCGLALTVLGITCTSHYSTDKDLRFKVGETHRLAGLDITLEALTKLTGPNYDGVKGQFAIYDQQQLITKLYPEKRVYQVQQMALSETAIKVGLWHDIYIALGESLGPDEWAVRLYDKPLVRWLWLGGLLMLCGGGISAWTLTRQRISKGTVES